MKIDRRVNGESKFRANRFLRVHLHILKALYEEESSNGSIPGENCVQEKYWDAVEGFLVERTTIKRANKRARRMGEIHDEAVNFQKTAPPLSVVGSHIISHQVSPQFQRYTARNTAAKGPRSNFMLITQPSPLYPTTRTPRGWNGRGSHSGRQRNEIQNSMEEDGGNAFGIVSGLLKRKHALVSRHLNRQNSLLLGLVKESQSRIETLESNLVSEKENASLDPSKNSIEDLMMEREESEDRQVRIETKLRLWKLLLHDLLGTISIPKSDC